MSDDFMNNKFFNPDKPKEEGSAIPSDLPQLVRTVQTGDKVYRIKDGRAHWVRNPAVLEAIGGDFGMVVSVEPVEFRKLAIGAPIDLASADQFKIEKKEEKPEEVSLSVYPEKTADGLTKGPLPGGETVSGLTSIIIPAYFMDYHLFHYTGNAIGSIRASKGDKGLKYEIILVVNGKTHIGFSRLEESLCDKVIVKEDNVGYGKAVNEGIRCSIGEYIVVMNNDVMVFDHWLEDMQEALGILDLVMATPMYGRPYARGKESMELREKTLGKPIGETFDPFRDFSCVMAKKALFDELGLFDEALFAYKEDLDFLNRMDKAGKKYASTKRVNTFHIIGATSMNMTPEQLRREEGRKYYESKWSK